MSECERQREFFLFSFPFFSFPFLFLFPLLFLRRMYLSGAFLDSSRVCPEQNDVLYSTPTQREGKKVKNKIKYAGIEGELSIQDARLQATGCSSAGL